MRLCSSLLTVALCCLIGMSTVCHAKKDRVTESPTMEPTKPPKNPKPDPPTIAPTPVEPPPTASPTILVTESPTTSPTVSPTASPTAPPTESPTASPTNSPTASPTNSPTASPTKSPTVSPTQAPTAEPTSLDSLVSVLLVPMDLVITTDGGPVDSDMLESDLELLLSREVLQRVFTNFSHVDLNITLSMPTRRRLEEMMDAYMEGMAYFLEGSDDIPSAEQMHEFLSTYFSILGSEDLTDHLVEGNPSIINVEFEAPEQDPTSIDQDPTTSSSGGGTFPMGAIIGIVVGCLVAILAVGILVWQQRKYKDDDSVGKHTPETSPGRSGAGSTPKGGGDDPSFLVRSPDDLSMDLSIGGESESMDSIYTSNSVNVKPKERTASAKPEQAYDPKRLEAVIKSAQEFSKEEGSTPELNTAISM